MQIRHFAAGQVIFLEGDPSDEAYIVRSGRVEILKNAASGTPRVRLLPLTPETKEVVPEDGIEVTRFPFRVGRRATSEESEVMAFNEIQLRDREPFRVSLNHFSLDLDVGGVVVRDRGSRQSTTVDDIALGAGRRATSCRSASASMRWSPAGPTRRSASRL